MRPSSLRTIFRSSSIWFQRKFALKEVLCVGIIIVIFLFILHGVFNLSTIGWFSKTFVGISSFSVKRTEPLPNFTASSTLVFKTAQACLRDSRYAPVETPPVFLSKGPIPEDELQAHYEDILDLTFPLRALNVTPYANYTGPWIEEYWIKTFCCSRHVREFGGLVPLFIQWNDMSHYKSDKGLVSLMRVLLLKLRKDVIYVTVSQNARGLRVAAPEYLHPSNTSNILVMSAGGVGHIAIPLLIGEQFWKQRNKSPMNLFSFAGSIEHRGGTRNRTVNIMIDENLKCNFPHQHYLGNDWTEVMRNTTLNLAPRGFGRTSFRLYELIQMGLVPVYIWDDEEWLPYGKSLASIKTFGFSVHIEEFRSWMEHICKRLETDKNYLGLNERVSLMKHFRDSHYTFDGVLRQMKYFFKDDARSDLVCRVHPPIF